MSVNIFSSLDKHFPKLAALGSEIEEVFYKDSQTVLMKGRLFAEELLNEVINQHNDLNHLRFMKLSDRIRYLEKEELLSKDIAKSFDSIRQLGNKSSHEYLGMDLEKAFKMHKRLYEISVWLMELYGDLSFLAPVYKIPEIENRNKQLDYLQELEEKTSSLERKIELILKESLQRKSTEEIAAARYDDGTGEIATYQDGKLVDGESHLLKELSKLKESSLEAVENSGQFTGFKDYLHVERPLQEYLKATLDKTYYVNKAQLILICGSVGDGKSHLLAYMNHKYPELVGNFHIHNDATESFDPLKSSLDTLADVLSPFSDANIEGSTDKLILAINLGVLHNFIESDQAKAKYQKLSEFVIEAKIFEALEVGTNKESSNFHLISFSDYQPFELKKEGALSSYYSQLFGKIIKQDEKNPFYRAYQMDKERNIKGFFMNNYELFMLEKVRDTIINLLIQSHIKHKSIISTRTLLNFIHDIIVPENIESDYINASSADKNRGLLFNLIFEGRDRSPLLATLGNLDPINERSSQVDTILVELNNSTEIVQTFEKYNNLDSLAEWKHDQEGMGAFQDLSEGSRQMYNRTLIRMIYFIGSEDIRKVFMNETYSEYLSLLYQYNIGNRTGLKYIQTLLKDSIFLWNGTPKEGYILMDASNQQIEIAQSLEVKPYFNHLVPREETVLERFHPSILLAQADKNKENPIFIDIDYPLYEMMKKLSKGYRPNRKDKENYIQFVEFIDKVMQFGNRKKELLFIDGRTDLMFKLSYDEDYEEFTFRRD